MVRAVRWEKRLTTAHYDVCWAYETGVGVGSTKRHRHVSYALPQHFYIFAAAAGTGMVTTDGSCVFTRVLRQPAHDRCHRIALRQQLPPDIHIRRNVLEKMLIARTQVIMRRMTRRRDGKAMLRTAAMTYKAVVTATTIGGQGLPLGLAKGNSPLAII